MIHDDDFSIKYLMELKQGTDLFFSRASCVTKEKEERESDEIVPEENGYATLCLFNPQVTSMDAIVMYADGISEKVSSVCKDLKYIHGIDEVYGLVAICDTLTIHKGERGQGMGKAFTLKLMEELKLLNVEILVMIPAYEAVETEAEIKRIQSYYKNNGFHRVKKNTNEPVMYTHL